ncbi:hypothetical protein ACFYWU_41235 [Streptomyces chrestomyceticus]|uniref:hypothetical protein n=1 Tax=Streptomyces chrestomyceticus TaxID=68185 RepID=UPI003679C3F2
MPHAHPAPDDIAPALTALRQALQAAGAPPRCRHTGPTAFRATFLLHDAAFGFAPDLRSLSADEAGAALVQTLAQQRIPVEVTVDADQMTDPLATFWLRRPADAHHLAAVILGHLPEPYAAAHHLRCALSAAGLPQLPVSVCKVPACPTVPAGPYPAGPCVELGDIEATLAFDLLDLLDPSEGAMPDCDDWEQLPRLTKFLTVALQETTGVSLDITAEPSCCACDRPNRFRLGRLTPGSARTLAHDVQTAVDRRQA